jgi:CRP-like cAMP-binding protein
MATASDVSCRNRLLAALEPRDYRELALHFERVQLGHGEVLLEAGEELQHVWFPEDCVISLTVLMREGGSSEAAAIGREGVVGLVSALGSRQVISRSVVQMSGDALRLPLGPLRTAFAANLRFRQLCLCYVEALLAQLLQSSACAALHTVEARLCRWLLQVHDRTEGRRVLSLTHDFLAEMLGVQRTTVTVTAQVLQRAGLITYRRGQVTILDRAGLEEAACECYADLCEQYERLLPRANG